MKKSDFTYTLPPELIAQKPLSDRNASRLLCLNKTMGLIEDKSFIDFIDLIDQRDLLVFNDTRVIPARLFGNKQSGGKVEILIERIVNDHCAIAHVKASKSPKPGTLIRLEHGYYCKMQAREGDLFRLEFMGEKKLVEIVELIGHIPIPPYIARDDDPSDRIRYQTVYAREAGAVAAPTAGLHFDVAMMEKIQAKGLQTAFVTLHVGGGTFQPVRVENLADHIMHQEYFHVPTATAEAVKHTRENGGRVIAIGTTSVRSLESASQDGQIAAMYGDTDLFITPGYQFKSVDALLTNFHLPESTLIMLVAAFAGYDKVMNAYQHAVANSYRFFSYGDAMFISR